MTGTAKVAIARPLLEVEHMVVNFPAGQGKRVHAVSDISFTVAAGETLGLVGESGCGKSTTGRAIIQAPRPTSGSVVFDGVELTALKGEALRQVRPKLQLIFQDAISALNPRRKVVDIVAEPLDLWHQGTKRERRDRVAEVLDAVGLDVAAVGDRRPFEFSGGQCQRISIARALVLKPKLLICDEPVSALDVSVRSQIIALLQNAKVRYGLTMVFIGHDLAVVKNISDRVAVMYLGELCELAPADELYATPMHHYTAALLDSVLEPDPETDRRAAGRVLEGDLPSSLEPPSGCRFRTRCPRAAERCATEEPTIRELAPGHFVACHFPSERPVEAFAPQAVAIPDKPSTAPVGGGLA